MSRQNAGFSIIEIVITLGILMTFTVAIVTMMRSGFDLRMGLAQNARVTQRLNVAMTKVAEDLQQTFYVDPNDETRGGGYRATKTVFRIEPSGDLDKLSFTYTGHQPMMANSGEPDQAFVVYEVKDDPVRPGYKNLYRGSVPIVATDFREDPPMRLVASYIRKFKVIPWKGDDWLKDRWDTERGDTRRRIPRMVRVEIESLATDPDPVDSTSVTDTSQMPVVAMKTIVTIPVGFQFPDLKQQLTNIRWY